MRPYRLALLALTVVALVGLAACHSNTSSDTEAEVYLSANLAQSTADVNMATSADVSNASVTISSHPKSPQVVLSQQDDAILTEWVVTCTRTDGGTVASPEWRNSETVYVPAGGSAPLANYRIFPQEYFQQPPLSQLLVSPFLDKETANPNIRQRLHVAIYGKTVAGKGVSVEWDQNINFFYAP